jgi:hypothetical protein
MMDKRKIYKKIKLNKNKKQYEIMSEYKLY